MKTKSVVALLLFTSFSTTEAQLLRAIGVKVGGVAANQTWDRASPFSDFDTDTRWGVDAGAFVEWLSIPLVSVSTEVHFVQKGMKFRTPITTEQQPEGTGEFVVLSPRLDYLSFPALVKLRVDLTGFSPYLLLGPRVDILLGSKADGFGAVIDKFKTSEFGGTIGVGFELTQLLDVRMGAEFRYSPSFQDGFSSQFAEVRNRSLEILLIIAM